jgi:hypothetical protein
MMHGSAQWGPLLCEFPHGLAQGQLISRHTLPTYSSGIPFGATEYNEETSHRVAEQLLLFRERLALTYDLPGSSSHEKNDEAFPIAPNPFHQPGQKQTGSTRLPDHSNGFVITVLKR